MTQDLNPGLFPSSLVLWMSCHTTHPLLPREALSLCSNNLSSDLQVKGSLYHTSLKALNVFWTAHQDYQCSCVFIPSIWNNWHWVLTVKPCSESLHVLTHLIITVANGTSTIWSVLQRKLSRLWQSDQNPCFEHNMHTPCIPTSSRATQNCLG